MLMEITVNLPNDAETHYGGNQGETPDQFVQRITTLHPEWTSLLITIVHCD